MKTSYTRVLAVGWLAGVVGVVGATPMPEVFTRELNDACNAPEGKGKCLNTSECAGISYPTGLCPNDPNDVQCCVKIQCSVPAGDGFCRSVENNGCAGGSFHPGTHKPYPCPGGSDIQCCVLDQEPEAGQGFGDAPAQEGFGDAPAHDGFGDAPAQEGFGDAPAEAGFGDAPLSCSVPAGAGLCLSVSQVGCSDGNFHPGTQAPWPCPGDEDIQCCVPAPADSGMGDAPEKITCSVPSGKGVCLSVSNDGCNSGSFHPGTSYPWPCPGDEDIQCCVPDDDLPPANEGMGDASEITCSVPAGDGVCLSVSEDGCSSGSFHPGTSYPWPCPGDDDIQCCVPDSGDDTDEKPKPKPPTGGRSGGNGRIDQNSIDLLKELEGWVPGVYDDATGIATIGYGHNCEAHPGTCEDLTIPLSKADGEKLMIGDLVGFEDCVCNLPNAKNLNVNEFGALVSFAYNSGCGGVENHWKSHMKREDFSGVCDDLPTTNTLRGLLTTRREKEQKLCRESTTVMCGC